MIKQLLLAAVLVFSFSAANAAVPKITLFYSDHCKVCLHVKKEVLPAIKEKYQGQVEWVELRVDDSAENVSMLFSAAEKYGKEAVYPAILVGGEFLTGKKEIASRLDGAIAEAIASGAQDAGMFNLRDIRDIFKGMSVMAVIGSGLVDGINPCAFAVIVFFVSFLAVYGYNKREIIYVGTSYCLAVFIAYMLIGLGLFKVLYAMSGFYSAMKIFYYLIAGFCFVLFGLSIYDYADYKRTGSSERQLLQLPKSFKAKINAVIGKNLRNREDRSPLSLSIAALAVGFIVSLIEAVCTGQVYVPTIAFIMKDPNLRGRAISYLLLYNLMFIVPLVVVFVLSLIGYESDRFNSFLKKHLGLTKLLLSGVFLALGLLMVFNM